MRAGLRQHERIKMQLRLKGSSLAEIARELKVAPTTVTIVSQGMRRSRRIEAAIAARLNVPVARLWPGRYVSATPEDESQAATLLGGG